MKTILTLTLALLVACGGEEPAPAPKKVANVPDGSAWQLAEEPESMDEMGVIDAKEKGNAETVVVVGRVAEMTRGYAAFRLVDASLDYCGQNKPEECPTPWDYCCDPPDKVKAAKMAVQFAGADGKVSKVDWKNELRPCDLVVLQGSLKTDEHGNVTVHATKFFRAERPEFKHEVRWP